MAADDTDGGDWVERMIQKRRQDQAKRAADLRKHRDPKESGSASKTQQSRERMEAVAVSELTWVLRDFEPTAARRLLRVAAAKLGWEPDALVVGETRDRDERKDGSK